MTTKTTVLADVTIHAKGEERTSYSLTTHVGKTNQGWPIMSNGATYEIWHPDGREMVIDMNGAIDAAALLLEAPKQITTDQQHIAQLLEAFDYAVREHAFIGAQRPEDHDAIHSEYVHARQKLWNFVLQMQALLSLGATVMREQNDSLIPLIDSVLGMIPESPEKAAFIEKLNVVRPPNFN